MTINLLYNCDIFSVIVYLLYVCVQPVLQDDMGNTALASVCVRTQALVIASPASAPARPAGLEPPVSWVSLRFNILSARPCPLISASREKPFVCMSCLNVTSI